jgi:hypothetical protein
MNLLMAPQRIVHESGQLSIWLQRDMVKLGLPLSVSMPVRSTKVCLDDLLVHNEPG